VSYSNNDGSDDIGGGSGRGGSKVAEAVAMTVSGAQDATHRQEDEMDSITKPGKELARDYLQQRRAANAPPPDLAEIRRQLGWDLIAMARRDRQLRRP
jgi:hypothetical protein